MKVKCPDGKVRKGSREKDGRILVVIDKKKVFAGFGSGNMTRQFRLQK